MKPYGLLNKISSFKGKIDWHIHEDGKKIDNWWVELKNIRSRTSIKKTVNDEIKKVVSENGK